MNDLYSSDSDFNIFQRKYMTTEQVIYEKMKKKEQELYTKKIEIYYRYNSLKKRVEDLKNDIDRLSNIYGSDSVTLMILRIEYNKYNEELKAIEEMMMVNNLIVTPIRDYEPRESFAAIEPVTVIENIKEKPISVAEPVEALPVAEHIQEKPVKVSSKRSKFFKILNVILNKFMIKRTIK